MNLRDALRQAEQQGKDTIHRGAEKLHHLETAIRRTVRGRSANTVPEDAEQQSAPAPKVRTGIVSVNGRDVGEMRCTGGRRSA
jgi:hypothetical protein